MSDPEEKVVRKIADYLHNDDHAETLECHMRLCERQECDREERYMESARAVFLIAHGG